ncbi:MAG: FHA domain-containing protein [Deltaproteobacteria bacterium]
MARLILMFNKQVIKEYPLLKDSVSIGRDDDNTIVIDNLAVSGYHARIDMAGSTYQTRKAQEVTQMSAFQIKAMSFQVSGNTSFSLWRPIRPKKRPKKRPLTRPWCSTP